MKFSKRKTWHVYSFFVYCMKRNYGRLPLSRSQRDPLKHFEIFVPRHIRFAELRKKEFEQPHVTNICVIELLKLEIIENIVEKRRNCSLGAISPFFHNIFLHVVRFTCLGRDQISTSS